MVLGALGQPVSQVRQALHTDSRSEALIKAAHVEAAKMAEWEAMALGDRASAREHYEAAKQLAESRGYTYRPLSELAAGDPRHLAERILSIAGEKLASLEVTQAVLGTVPEALPTLLELREEYYELTRTRHLKKTEAQLKRFRFRASAQSRIFWRFWLIAARGNLLRECQSTKSPEMMRWRSAIGGHNELKMAGTRKRPTRISAISRKCGTLGPLLKRSPLITPLQNCVSKFVVGTRPKLRHSASVGCVTEF